MESEHTVTISYADAVYLRHALENDIRRLSQLVKDDSIMQTKRKDILDRLKRKMDEA